MGGAGTALVAIDGIAYGLLLFVVAAGLTLTLGIARLLNLAHGIFFLTGAYLGWWLIHASWLGMANALATAVAAGVVGGLTLTLVARLTRGPLDQALATIGIALIGGDILTRIFGAQPLSVDPPASIAGTVTILGRPYPQYRLVFIAVALALAIVGWLVIARTRVGVLVRASGDDPQMLDALGVHSGRVRAAVIVVGGVLGVTGGVLGSPVLGPAPGLDHTILILCLIIVVAAPAGSIPGVLITALVVGQIQTTAVASWPAAAPYLPYAALAAVLLLRTRSLQQTHRNSP
jgi:branched-chain amino acid transport system permease protein